MPRSTAALLFHHVGPERPGSHPWLTVTPGRFERLVRALERRGYVGVSAAEWAASREGEAGLPGRPVVVTFDDGLADIGEFALPLLRELGWRATVFISSSSVGKNNFWDGEAAGSHRVMEAGDIRRWADAGIEFGAHGRTHRDLASLDATELRDEVGADRQALASILGTPPTSFAYPYGGHTAAVRGVVGEDFAVAFGLEEGLNRPHTDRMQLRRTMVQSRDGVVDALLRARLGRSPLDPVRRALRPRQRLRGLRGARSASSSS